MKSLADRIMLLWGWRRSGITFLAGAMSALALPPIGFPVVLFITFPVLVWLLDGAVDSNDRRRVRMLWPAFATGWWFGFGYFLAGLYWIGHAFLVNADTFGWMLPLAVVALPAGLALFFGVGAAIARCFWSDSAWRILALALGLGISEWLRGHVLTGFPWNLVGHALTVHPWPLQSASVFGVYGLTVVAVAVAAAPATLGDERRRLFPAIAALLAVVGIVGFGAWRLDGAEPPAPTETRLRLVQPNIPQDEKWLPENRAAIFAQFIEMSRDDGPQAADIDAVIWPEAAVPFFLSREPGALGAIAEILPFGRYLITGSNTADQDIAGQSPRYFNSAYLIDDAGSIAARYDKNRLVPFGEMLPFESTLNQLGIRKLVTLPGTFVAGRGADLMEAPGLPPFRVLICYETIFSGSVSSGGGRPQWLLNLTNDAWFGDGLGPRQHFHHARIRAVEEGLPLVRVANTGISALIDPFGLIEASISLNERGVVDILLPSSLPHTLFARYGLLTMFGLWAACFVGAMFGKLAQRGK